MAQGVFHIALEPPDAYAAEAELLGGLHVVLPEAPSGNLSETTRPSLANPGPGTGPVRLEGSPGPLVGPQRGVWRV